MKRAALRGRSTTLLGHLALGAAGLAVQTAFGADAPDTARRCERLRSLSDFPASTEITLAKFNPGGSLAGNGAALPDHCQIRGIIGKRTGADGLTYGTHFEVRLPAPALWNGRFMFQGG